MINSIFDKDTLEAAVKNAVDELKRLFEEHSTSTFKHEDLTVLVKLFTDFDTLKKRIKEGNSEEVRNPPEQAPDEIVNGLVTPYVDFGVYHKLIDGDQYNKKIFDNFADELSGLSEDFSESVYL